jgi:hypothetical protein
VLINTVSDDSIGLIVTYTTHNVVLFTGRSTPDCTVEKLCAGYHYPLFRFESFTSYLLLSHSTWGLSPRRLNFPCHLTASSLARQSEFIAGGAGRKILCRVRGTITRYFEDRGVDGGSVIRSRSSQVPNTLKSWGLHASSLAPRYCKANTRKDPVSLSFHSFEEKQ